MGEPLCSGVKGEAKSLGLEMEHMVSSRTLVSPSLSVWQARSDANDVALFGLVGVVMGVVDPVTGIDVEGVGDGVNFNSVQVALPRDFAK